MPDYSIILTDQGAPFSSDIGEMKRRIENLQQIIERIADENVLPALGRNYNASGLKTHTGVLKQAITKRGAQGNVVKIDGNHLTVGVDYQTIPYARWALEGRGPVYAKNKRFLRFEINGKVIFAKRVGPAPAHDVYYLTGSDLAEIQQKTNILLTEDRRG